MSNFFKKLISIINRLSHWFDVIIVYFICNWLYNGQFAGSKFGWIVYIFVVLQLFWAIKYEWKVFKSKSIVNEILDNGRVLGFCGAQGRGKSSLSAFMASNSRFSHVYTNSPVKLNGKYTCMLEDDIICLDSKVEDYSLLSIDEATIFFHNLKANVTKNFDDKLYAQEIFTQCVRHFTDGNIFYISTNNERLPSVLRDNVSMTILCVEQHNKRISFITGTIITLISMCFGLKIRNGMRCWTIQTFNKIPDSNYIFDLSNQNADTNIKKFANLIEIYTFNNSEKFDYNDRFLQGLYAELPQHVNHYWNSLEFNEDLLYKLGYGELLAFFKAKGRKRTST